MKTSKMILPNELVNQIKSVKKQLETIADSNETTNVTADWLYNLCDNLNELT
jgi:DNA-binding Xre family transcriptional regulator